MDEMIAKRHWKDSATKLERKRIDALLTERNLLNAELQKLRDRCWKRMQRSGK